MFENATVLVTGATGFLGGALARRLAADGAQVRALARRAGRDSYLRGVPGVEVVMGDILDAERMRQLTSGCHYVFHSAAALGGPLAQQRRTNVDGTRNVALAAAAAHVKRLVHISSIAVYGYACRGDIAEDTPQQPGRPAYNITKSEAETALQQVAAETGLSYSVIRPGMIYGPRSGAWTAQLFKLARRRPTVWLGDGSGSAYPIFVDDVVDLALQLAIHPAAEGQAFNCAPDPSPTWRQLLGKYAQLAGHESWLAVPVILARALAPLIEAGLTLRGIPQDLPLLVEYATSQRTFRMDKARSLLGWQPRVDLETGVTRCAPYLREIGLLR
ncbi:MAG: NAD-dependent epimerase/dehydratase family protein [Aggregatilineales bacterium]